VRLVVILIVDEETPHRVREEGPQPEKKPLQTRRDDARLRAGRRPRMSASKSSGVEPPRPWSPCTVV
jgi:hypothetical protein